MNLFVKIKKITVLNNTIMENTKKIATFLLLASMLHACNMNRPPKCDDKQVQELVLEIISEDLKNESLKTTSRSSGFFGLMQSRIYVRVFNSMAYNESPDYSDLNKYRGQEEKLDKILIALDSLFHPKNFQLKNILISKIDKELKKCECDADLSFIDSTKHTEEPINVNYTAQYSEDGNLVVKVISVE